MTRELNPMIAGAIVAGLIVVALLFFFIRGRMTGTPDTRRSETQGQRMMDAMQRAQPGGAPNYNPGMQGGAPGYNPGMQGGRPMMPGQPAPPPQ